MELDTNQNKVVENWSRRDTSWWRIFLENQLNILASPNFTPSSGITPPSSTAILSPESVNPYPKKVVIQKASRMRMEKGFYWNSRKKKTTTDTRTKRKKTTQINEGESKGIRNRKEIIGSNRN